MTTFIQTALVAVTFISLSLPAGAQNNGTTAGDETIEFPKDSMGMAPHLSGDLYSYSKSSGVAGHEEQITSRLRDEDPELSPKTDNLGNLIITVGSGAPHRLIVTAVDEPGYVVSGITADGYLRVQRLPQAAPSPVFDALNFAQPVIVKTRSNRLVNGVFAGLSVHLQPGRVNGPKMNHPDELYVDIGAKNADEVRSFGVDVLDTVVNDQPDIDSLGNELQAGRSVGERFGVAALSELLSKVRLSKTLRTRGTTTIAFVTQSWLGGRGLNRLLEEVRADEMIYIGPIGRPVAKENAAAEPKFTPGDGVLLGLEDSKAPLTGVAARLQEVASRRGLELKTVSAQKPRLAAYAKANEFPGQFVQLGVPTLWATTPAQVVSLHDVEKLESLLEGYLQISSGPRRGVPGGRAGNPSIPSFENMVKAYGASRHEDRVRNEIRNALPWWTRDKTTTDAAGNLILHIGDGKREAKAPSIAFVAHMDELGYEVKKIEDDGRLQVEVLGGGYPQYFLGHVALVHAKQGKEIGAVMELPDGWDKPGYEFPGGMRSMDEPAHVYVGTRSKEETEKLGIALGDYVTIPKEYRPLMGTRANARSFDDRVGCWALIEAVRTLGPNLRGRDVTLVWSTREEIGLEGAAAFAEQAAKANRVPDFVFAVDTFVSSDSPLESKRFGDAELGKGFVVRAVDNSNIVPVQYVDRVMALAKENGIAVQHGVTGGGNDGSVFLRYGSGDIALGWPLRYSHSPAEVIDTKDLDALGKIIAVLAKSW